METVYKKYRPAREILMEYYGYNDLRKIVRQDWEDEDEKYKKHCDILYEEYEQAHVNEKRREENSKSTRIANKLEQMKMTEELVTKIKMRNTK